MFDGEFDFERDALFGISIAQVWRCSMDEIATKRERSDKAVTTRHVPLESQGEIEQGYIFRFAIFTSTF